MTKKNLALRNYQKPRIHKPISCPRTGPTQQSLKDECDINKIMGKYKKTGRIPQTMRPKRYGEQKINGFTEMQNHIASVKSLYQSLPSETQEKFDNQDDFLEAVSDPDREDELLEAGIAYRPGLELEPDGHSKEEEAEIEPTEEEKETLADPEPSEAPA